jgi:phosphoglycerate dehydrogenase-like enzyme
MAGTKALYILRPEAREMIYGADEQRDISRLVDVYAPPLTAADVAARPEILQPCEVIFSGWGAPRMDEAFLAAAPNLKALFYGAGSIRGAVTDACWDRGLLVTSAVAANAVPVAEYTLAVMLLGLKRFWQQAEAYHAGRPRQSITIAGAYRSTVGLVSLGTIGRLVCGLLKPFDVRIVAYDPFAKPADAAALGVELVSLDEVFARADVVSLHTPNLPETRGLITGAHIGAMKPSAVFINTARGAVVREDELAAALAARPDLWAVLDVTVGESPEADAPLLRLPNVTRTPHIAGSQAGECRRMGRYMVEELTRYLAGEPLRYGITRERARIMA